MMDSVSCCSWAGVDGARFEAEDDKALWRGADGGDAEGEGGVGFLVDSAIEIGPCGGQARDQEVIHPGGDPCRGARFELDIPDLQGVIVENLDFAGVGLESKLQEIGRCDACIGGGQFADAEPPDSLVRGDPEQEFAGGDLGDSVHDPCAGYLQGDAQLRDLDRSEFERRLGGGCAVG